jgi:hypothetical protein
MNPFLLDPTSRLQDWKDFREELRVEPESKALQLTADYWAKAPLMKCAYDFNDCTDWPSAWEMINAGEWCPYSVAIGMEFTLRLAGWNPERLTLLTIRDYDISDERMILKIDESLVLNYNVGMVEEYPKTTHDVMAAFRNDGKRYSRITI